MVQSTLSELSSFPELELLSVAVPAGDLYMARLWSEGGV